MLIPLDVGVAVPARFPSPFNSTPHPLAQLAAKHLRKRLPEIASHHNYLSDGGKMFGVLVVRDRTGQIGYLAGFSGMLAEKWCHDHFVPPVFDPAFRARALGPGERELQQLTSEIDLVATSREIRVRMQLMLRAEIQTKRQLSAIKLRNHQRKLTRRQIRLQSMDKITESSLARQSSDDRRELRALRQAIDTRLVNAQADCAQAHRLLDDLRERRRVLSRQLQIQLFDGYDLCAVNGDRTLVKNLFVDALPPGGAADCAAPKLLQHANLRALQPLCLAEFWWQPGGGQRGLRHHGHYYPSCRSKCAPVLPFLLRGLEVEPAGHLSVPQFDLGEPRVIHEDRDIVVVSKPAGMLSVPGRWHCDSVERRLFDKYSVGQQQRMLVHRLDQATSGLLIAARNRRAHKALHLQFENREIEKRYVAVLAADTLSDSGQIDLPVRVDLEDRPRQLVCYRYGKPATTRYQVIDRTAVGTRVNFYPLSGRTHQLRVHAAHPDGLAAPIVGDELYGKPGKRLLLHADYLRFQHPSGGMLELHDNAPF